MRLTIATIGKLKDLERDLVARYVARCEASGRALALGPLKIVELAESRATASAERKADEAARLTKAVTGADYRIALDERGHAWSSDTLARRLARCRDDGVQHMAFLIGGPDGHAPDLVAAAHETLSLSAMTLPHGLARLVLAEQIYRATTILAGHPYHRA